MKYSLEEMEEALKQLDANAKPMLGLTGALIGFMPAIAVLWVMAHMQLILIVMLAIPPFIIGYFAKFLGRCYRAKHRLAAATLGAICHVIGCYLLGISILFYILTPVAFAVAMVTAKIKLQDIHELAFIQKDLGKIGGP